MTIQELKRSTKSVRSKFKSVEPTKSAISKRYVKSKKRLDFKAEVRGSTGDYQVKISFGNIDESKEKGKSKKIKTKSGFLSLAKPSIRKSPVAVRCSCSDYQFTWAPHNQRAGISLKPDVPKYKPTGTGHVQNPDRKVGMCKHIAGTISKLKELGEII